ncbi:MAG: hypothetical protein K0Q94_505 [Paenibacillus sp.]|nr:hypothetical protein [Paenibacillus sp.]
MVCSEHFAQLWRDCEERIGFRIAAEVWFFHRSHLARFRSSFRLALHTGRPLLRYISEQQNGRIRNRVFVSPLHAVGGVYARTD